MLGSIIPIVHQMSYTICRGVVNAWNQTVTDDCMCIMKVIGYNGSAFDPRDGTFWVQCSCWKEH